MKIAIVQNVPITDHRVVHTDGVARILVCKGHEVDVIIQKSNDKSQFEGPNYNVIELEGGTYSLNGQLRFTFELFKYLIMKNYDVIHAKNPFSSIIAPILIRVVGKKFTLLYDLRGLWVDFMEEVGENKMTWIPILKKIDIICMNLCDGIIAISDELARILIARGANPKKLRVIEGDGVETKKIRDLTPIDLTESLKLKPPIVGYIGSISMVRSSHKIIEAFRYVIEEVPDAYLVMIGPIYGEDKIRKFIEEMKLTEKVLLLGYLETHDMVLRYCKSFDAVLAYHDINLPTFNVMVPTKILEYLACGRPIVATDHKAHTNILKHGFNAVLTKQDSQSYAEGIIVVLKDNQLATRISNKALQCAEKFDFNIIVGQILDSYYHALRT